MTQKLLETLEAALARLPQDVALPREASVLVQFAAGDWAGIKEQVAAARTQLDAATKHNIADAAGVVSHSAGGQPLAPDARLDAALGTLPDAAAATPVVAAAAQSAAPASADAPPAASPPQGATS